MAYAGLTPAELTLLSHSEKKRALYADDIFFLEPWHVLRERGAAKVRAMLRDCALIVFKPDAIVSRVVSPALAFLAERGFRPLASVSFRYDRLMIREAWRYQINIASAQRLAVVDQLLLATPSLLVALACDGAHGFASASHFIHALKGPAVPEQRRPEHLRYHIGGGAGLLNKVHIPDEPADLVRELSVYLHGEERDHVLTALLERVHVQGLDAQLERLYGAHPQHPLRFDESQAVVERLARQKAVSPELLERVRCLRADQTHDWQGLFSALARAGVQVPTWDFLTLACHLTVADRPGMAPVL